MSKDKDYSVVVGKNEYAAAVLFIYLHAENNEKLENRIWLQT